MAFIGMTIPLFLAGAGGYWMLPRRCVSCSGLHLWSMPTTSRGRALLRFVTRLILVSASPAMPVSPVGLMFVGAIPGRSLLAAAARGGDDHHLPAIVTPTPDPVTMFYGGNCWILLYFSAGDLRPGGSTSGGRCRL